MRTGSHASSQLITMQQPHIERISCVVMYVSTSRYVNSTRMQYILKMWHVSLRVRASTYLSFGVRTMKGRYVSSDVIWI